jgi:preprotein translocase subunit SecF
MVVFPLSRLRRRVWWVSLLLLLISVLGLVLQCHDSGAAPPRS